MKRAFLFAMVAAAAVAAPKHASAQITPQIGVYVPGDDFEDLKEGANTVRVNKEGALALGLNVGLGPLRGSLAYASGAKLTQSGTSGEVGEGKLLAGAVDLVLRPLPRLIVVQPYLLGGAGLRRANYDYDDDGLNAFPKNDSDFALHAGVGVDVKLGPLGLSAEIQDFISKEDGGGFGRHDGFGFIGLKLGM